MDKYINQIVLIQVDKDNSIPNIGEKGRIIKIKEHRSVEINSDEFIYIPYDVAFPCDFNDIRFYAEEETVLVSEE